MQKWQKTLKNANLCVLIYAINTDGSWEPQRSKTSKGKQEKKLCKKKKKKEISAKMKK